MENYYNGYANNYQPAPSGSNAPNNYGGDNGHALDWDAEIENDGQEFIIAPAGDYDFVVTGFERGYFNGSDNFPACSKAVLTIQVQTDKGPASFKYTLMLHTKAEWKLCQFFTAIGQRKHGQRVAMNWNAVMGARGRCKVKIRNYKNSSGEERQANDIDKFYAPDAQSDLPFTMGDSTRSTTAQPAPQAAGDQYSTGGYNGGYVPGKF